MNHCGLFSLSNNVMQKFHFRSQIISLYFLPNFENVFARYLESTLQKALRQQCIHTFKVRTTCNEFIFTEVLIICKLHTISGIVIQCTMYRGVTQKCKIFFWGQKVKKQLIFTIFDRRRRSSKKLALLTQIMNHTYIFTFQSFFA